MYFDWYYLILVVPAMIFSLIASASVNSTYKKYSRQIAGRGLTGAQAARMVLDANGLRGVPIERVSGELTDHYDPKSNVIRLSDSVYSSPSTAAVGVACHEVGHAIQYATGYGPIKLRMAIIPLTNIGSRLSVPLIIIGIILGGVSDLFYYVAYAGIFFFALVVLFQLVTLPVEFNASKRALATIENGGILSRGEELAGAQKVLRAAAMTYVAALAVSISQLLRFIMLVGRRRD